MKRQFDVTIADLILIGLVALAVGTISVMARTSQSNRHISPALPSSESPWIFPSLPKGIAP